MKSSVTHFVSYDLRGEDLSLNLQGGCEQPTKSACYLCLLLSAGLMRYNLPSPRRPHGSERLQRFD